MKPQTNTGRAAAQESPAQPWTLIASLKTLHERRRNSQRLPIFIDGTPFRTTHGQAMSTIIGLGAGIWAATTFPGLDHVAHAIGIAITTALGWGAGTFFFPEGKLTPLGSWDELTAMTDRELIAHYAEQQEAPSVQAFIEHLHLGYRFDRINSDEARLLAAAGYSIPTIQLDTGPEIAISSPERPAKAPNPTEAVGELHEAILARWRPYELDVAKLIDYPSMSDVRVPETAAMLRAMRAADLARTAPTDEYRDAVLTFETAFEVAEREAHHRATSTLPEADRAKLATAKQLLALAEDGAATDHERQAAYQRMRKLLDGLIIIPEPAQRHLESALRLQIAVSHIGTER